MTEISHENLSATGGFVDQAGVALTNGGGTLVLGTHDSVSLKLPNFQPSTLCRKC